MTDLERSIVSMINEFQKSIAYEPSDYQMLHGVKYRKKMEQSNIDKIRKCYKNNSLDAAYQLKTYYCENGICSSTIVLKMRPESSASNDVLPIVIHNDLDNKEYEYNLYVIEVFVDCGKYKVFDVLSSNEVMWLDKYLDKVCKTNNCTRDKLRYDMGLLAPCHAYAGNMFELGDIIRYLDKEYCIGKPRFSMINSQDEDILITDDIVLNVDEIAKDFDVSIDEFAKVMYETFDKVNTVKINLLATLSQDISYVVPRMSNVLRETIFDDDKICGCIQLLGN